MKKLINMIAMIAIASFIFTGCTEDLCDDVICLNGSDGTCLDGVCECPAGFEDADCGSKSVDKFLGNWDAAGTCDPSDGDPFTVAYFASVDSSSTDVTNALISNFGGFDENLVWTTNVDGSTITLPLSDAGIGTGETVEGTGNISSDGNTVTWTYTLAGTGFTESCTETWTKQ